MAKDTIYREDALQALVECEDIKGYAYRQLEDAIKAIPSADRPQGEWIVSCDDSICPICGKDEAEFIYGTEIWYGQGKSHFCPNCGARMRPRLQGKHFDSIIIDEDAMKGADDA